jgi:hypothetical protein
MITETRYDIKFQKRRMAVVPNTGDKIGFGWEGMLHFKKIRKKEKTSMNLAEEEMDLKMRKLAGISRIT